MLSRRDFTNLLAGTALAAGAPAARANATGGGLTVAFDGAAVPSFVLDPHNCRFAPQARVLRSIFDNLVVLREDQSVAPWLATAWEISPDRTQYTFTLRQDVTFHDDTPFNAAAVKANFDRILNPVNALQSLSQIGPYTGATVLSPFQVRLEFSAPFEPLLHNLSATGLAIASPAAVQKYGKAFGQNPVGTGPFKFTSLTPGTQIRLAKNLAYQWAPAGAAHPGPALLDQLIFADVPEQLTRVSALQSGQVQVADLIPAQNIAAFKADPGFSFQQKEMLDTTYALMPNVAKAPWNDLQIRQALKLSLDIDLIVRVIYFGTIQRAWSPLSHQLFGSAEQAMTGSWKPDPAQARAILDAKAWVPGADGIRVKNGQRLSLSFIDTQGNREQRLDVIELVRRQLNASGIDLVIDSQPPGNYLKKLADNDYDLAAGAQYAADPDVLRSFFVPDARSQMEALNENDPVLTQLLVAGAAEGDSAKRANLYVQAQQRIIDQVYLIPIYELRYNLAAAVNVQGIVLDAHGFPNYHGAALGSG